MLTELTAKIKGPNRHLQIQLPISIEPDHEPEPDGAVILGGIRDFVNRLPGPEDVACIIDAAAGIGQYLIIDLREMRVVEMTEPEVLAGRYRSVKVFEKGDLVRISLG